MKHKFKHAYMDTAKRFAELSHAQRLKVGSIIVKEDRIISIGYNGMPSGWDNECEDKVYADENLMKHMSPSEILAEWPLEDAQGRYKLVTKAEVLHAEMNAVSKLTGSASESSIGASLFVTHSCCINCAKAIYQSGITEVYYHTEYRSNDGIDFLKKCGIKVEKLDV